MGISISLCMIVKNEENTLEACLSSVSGIADEINIVDTGSEDRTVEIAKSYTDRVYHFKWVNDFSKARNFSFSKATKDYILWLDADDIVTPENRDRIIKLKATLKKNIKYVTMLYHTTHLENGMPSDIARRERLVKRSENFLWVGKIHEAIKVSGNHLETDIFITHTHSDPEDSIASHTRNIEIIEQIIKDGEADSRVLSYYVGSLYSVGRVDEAYEQTKRILSNPNGDYRSGFYITAHELFFQKGDMEAALNVLLDNERVGSDKSEFYCILGGFFYNQLNDVDSALICFQKALSCNGREPGGGFSVRNNDYYYFEPLRSIANCYIKLKQYSKALESAEKALEYRPDDADILALTDKLSRIVELVKMQKI